MNMIGEIIDAFHWGLGRKVIENWFEDRFAVHPTQNAIGVNHGELYGKPINSVFFFVNSEYGFVLSRFTLIFEASKMNDFITESIYKKIRSDLVQLFGVPLSSSEYEKNLVKELRFSKTEIWKTKDSFFSLNKKLKKDGFNDDEIGVGFLASDIKNDSLGKYI